MKTASLYFFALLILISCTNHLSEEEVRFMPYESGDTLIFKNLIDKSIDTIYITKVDRYIPDGKQIYFNEYIIAYRENRRQLITLASGYFKDSESYLEIRGLAGRQYLKDIANKPSISLTTTFLTFEDVVLFEGLADKGTTTGIKRVYWSKSSGIVQFEEKNNTI